MKDWLMDTTSVLDKENVTCSGSKVKGEIKVYNDQQTQVTYNRSIDCFMAWAFCQIWPNQNKSRSKIFFSPYL